MEIRPLLKGAWGLLATNLPQRKHQVGGTHLRREGLRWGAGKEHTVTGPFRPTGRPWRGQTLPQEGQEKEEKVSETRRGRDREAAQLPRERSREWRGLRE